jgi:hypothetical protein
MLEMKIVVPAVLRRFELHPTEPGAEPARRRNISIRPGRGSRFVLEPRRTRVAVAA